MFLCLYVFLEMIISKPSMEENTIKLFHSFYFGRLHLGFFLILRRKMSPGQSQLPFGSEASTIFGNIGMAGLFQAAVSIFLNKFFIHILSAQFL